MIKVVKFFEIDSILMGKIDFLGSDIVIYPNVTTKGRSLAVKGNIEKVFLQFFKNLSMIFKKSLSVSENPFVEKIPRRPTRSPVLGKTRTAVAYRKKMFRPFRS